MHLTMCTMVETKVSTLDSKNVKLSSDDDDMNTPRNIITEAINIEKNHTNNSGESDDEEFINADGRLSSTTYVIQMDNKCEDLIDVDERERLAREHCDVGDEEESSDDEELHCVSSHIPIDSSTEVLGESPYSNEYFGAPVPTPIQLGLKDILPDDNDQVQNIKQRKYPVLPSIGKKLEDEKQEEESDDSEPTINQLDFTRERMETEADFFADYRVNTSVVKPTPRNAPLPPIGQTYSPPNTAH